MSQKSESFFLSAQLGKNDKTTRPVLENNSDVPSNEPLKSGVDFIHKLLDSKITGSYQVILENNSGDKEKYLNRLYSLLEVVRCPLEGIPLPEDERGLEEFLNSRIDTIIEQFKNRLQSATRIEMFGRIDDKFVTLFVGVEDPVSKELLTVGDEYELIYGDCFKLWGEVPDVSYNEDETPSPAKIIIDLPTEVHSFKWGPNLKDAGVLFIDLEESRGELIIDPQEEVIEISQFGYYSSLPPELREKYLIPNLDPRKHVVTETPDRENNSMFNRIQRKILT